MVHTMHVKQWENACLASHKILQSEGQDELGKGECNCGRELYGINDTSMIRSRLASYLFFAIATDDIKPLHEIDEPDRRISHVAISAGSRTNQKS
jgi:hypothetical protein